MELLAVTWENKQVQFQERFNYSPPYPPYPKGPQPKLSLDTEKDMPETRDAIKVMDIIKIWLGYAREEKLN